MPARLHFSNSLDVLADRLNENLAAEGGDPFRAPRIATPSAATRDWLKIRLAELRGLAVNLSFLPLENLLWDRLAERDRLRDVPERNPARLLDGDAFQGLVLAQLRAAPPVALRAYLDREDPHDAARRLCQLSGRLAALFREYEYNRVAEHGHRGLAESWMRGEPSFELRLGGGNDARAVARREEVRALEGWQMEIYRALFHPETGLRDRWGEATKTYRYTLPQYAELALRDPEPLTAELTAPVFHLFGLSNVSPFHRDLIGRLANLERGAARFEIYALNPCAEYWEDALSLRERRARGRRALTAATVPAARVEATRFDDAERDAGEAREEEAENGLLALFGKPGRETVKLWCQLTDHDFLEDFREPEGHSLLSAVRASMLHRSGPLETRVPPDESFRLRKAADARAEIAAVRAECAALLRARPEVRPEDLAIVVADADTSLPLLRAAFAGRDETPGNIPVLLPESDTTSDSPLLEGLGDLLRLGAGVADRSEVIALLDNPAARAAAGLDDSRLEVAADFLTAAGFQQGWDEGVSSVRATVDRALWGFALDPEDPATDAAAPENVAAGVSMLEREEAARLLRWLEDLRLATRPLRDRAARAFPEWARILRGLGERFFDPQARDARAGFELSRFLDDLESWGQWGAEAPGTCDAVLVRTLFEDRFRAGARAGRASFLRGGVRVGSLSTLRGLPFRHVWILGLSSDFPASAEAAPLDLRAYRRIPGESDPAARDLYALLETLAATRESVSLSWPERGVDGKERQPSRALTGLMAWLEADILPEDAPLKFEEMTPPPEAPLPAFAPQSVDWAAEPARDAARATDWRRLEEFLANPASQATGSRFRVNAWDSPLEPEEYHAAALFLDKHEDAALYEAALRAELSEPGSGEAVFDRLWEKQRRAGLLPPHPFDALEEKRLRRQLASKLSAEAEMLRAQMLAHGLRFEGTLRLGPQDSKRAEPPVLNLPALDGSTLGLSLRIGGLFPGFFRAENGRGWALRVKEGREFPVFLLQAWAAATELPGPLGFLQGPARVFLHGGKAPRAHELPALARDEARAILHDLLSDYLCAEQGESALEDLPLTCIAKILEETGGNPDAVDDWPQAIHEYRRANEDGAHARVDRREKLLRAIGPEVPADASGTIRRRILPWITWRKALVENEAPEGDEP